MGCVEAVADASHFDGQGQQLSLDKAIGYRIDRKCEELGLIVRPLINMCVFSPPLVITKDEVDLMFDILDEALAQISQEFDAGRKST